MLCAKRRLQGSRWQNSRGDLQALEWNFEMLKVILLGSQ
jgi:hypothetical protein